MLVRVLLQVVVILQLVGKLEPTSQVDVVMLFLETTLVSVVLSLVVVI